MTTAQDFIATSTSTETNTEEFILDYTSRKIAIQRALETTRDVRLSKETIHLFLSLVVQHSTTSYHFKSIKARSSYLIFYWSASPDLSALSTARKWRQCSWIG